MEDNSQVVAPATENAATASTENQVDIAALQRFAFNEAPPAPTETAPSTTTEQTQTITETTPAVTETTPASTDYDLIDEFQLLQNHTGFKSWDEVKGALEEYKTLKTTPPTAAEIKYENEESKRIHDALVAGHYKEVRDYLNAQELLSGTDNMNDEQRLKLYIKMQNPLFSDRLVNEEYNDTYSLDEENIDENKLERERLKLEQRKINDVKAANEYFTKYKTQIQLPKIEPAVAQNVVNQDYEDYKASTAKNLETYNNVILPAINALKEQDVTFAINVNDANNQMQFDVNIVPEKADFDAAKAMASDYERYMQAAFYDKKGIFSAAKLERAILLEKNFDKYAQSIARQAVNAERKRVINSTTDNEQVRRDYNINPQDDQMKQLEDFAFQGIRR